MPSGFVFNSVRGLTIATTEAADDPPVRMLVCAMNKQDRTNGRTIKVFIILFLNYRHEVAKTLRKATFLLTHGAT
jgi:hypothetical protein